MSERTAIVTLAIGDAFAKRWKKLCEPNWKTYADRHGYDVVCLTEPLDTSERAGSRSPSWQKLLVGTHPFTRDYDRLVWMDADVLINPLAPAMTEGVPIDRVGAVDEYSTPTRELYLQTIQKLYAHWEATHQEYVNNPTPQDYYAAWELPPTHDAVVQAGVMVFSPDHHNLLFERVYRTYEERGRAFNFEMRPLSWELLEADCVTWIDPRFNYVFGIYKALFHPFLLNNPGHPDAAQVATEALHAVHCLHFAGDVNQMYLASDEKPSHPRRERAVETAYRRPIKELRSPVALALFSRPDMTARLLDSVREAKPKRLLVFADGPRPGVDGEAELCAETRAVLDRVDWPCEVQTNLAEANMGSRRRLETGLDWVFSQTEEAIVIEDDCLPEQTFYPYCDELLARYRDDERVFAISGDDFRYRPELPAESYIFSRYPLIWGWATWGRAWRRHDPTLARWPHLREEGWLEDFLGDANAAVYWGHRFDQVHAGGLSWDIGWLFTCWADQGLTALPTVNLVTNLGFRGDATHTVPLDEHRSPFAAIPTEPIAFPLAGPEEVARDQETDDFIEDVVFSGNLQRAFARLREVTRARKARA